MKYTLLELTRRILGSMESDLVSDIAETQEAIDVVEIIKECYFDIVGYGELAEHDGPFKLDASTDNTKPVLMLLPSNVIRLDWIKYNYGDLVKPEYSNLFYRTNRDFIDMQMAFDPGDPDLYSMTQTINGDPFVFKYRNDRTPSFYTVFDERFVIFDAYDASLESTLTTERSIGYGLLSPEFILSNDFIPDLDHRQFQLLLQDAKATAHMELKQQQNPKAEQKYRYNRILAQKTRDDNNPAASSQKRIVFGRMPR